MLNKTISFLIVFYVLVISTEQRVHKKKSPPHRRNHLQVETKNGVVQGRQSKTVHAGKTFFSYQGIPFAKPPVGNLRFSDPQSAENWTGILDATIEKPICVQMSTVNGSENCLYLNIYTTVSPNANKSSLLPVMIYIHGGGFVDGYALYDLFQPDYILEEGVVYVSIQYRLGVFGFLSTGDDVIPGNFGLKDQVKAITWIYDNVVAFGGDPKKITLFGVSAGAASIAYLAQTPQLYGILSGVILQSGSSLAEWSLARYPKNYALAYGHLIGINTENSTELLNELRTRTTSELSSPAGAFCTAVFLLNRLKSFAFAPVIEKNHKNAIITQTTYPLLQRGRLNRIPHIIGFTSQEVKSLGTMPPSTISNFWLFDIDPTNYLPLDMNINGSLEAEVGRKIENYYSKYGTGTQNKMRFFSDNYFVRPARQHVRLIHRFAPTYLYEFAYESRNSSSVDGITGVGHGEELKYLLPSSHESPPPQADLLTRFRFVKLWTNFAKYGNPTPRPDSLLEKVLWKNVSSDTKIAYLSINSTIENKINPHKDSMDFWDGIYAQYGNPPYGTYK